MLSAATAQTICARRIGSGLIARKTDTRRAALSSGVGIATSILAIAKRIGS